jgi:hypothetical protein
MEELGLECATYANIMAETLAFINWAAHIDAIDIKFVLAPPHASGSFHVINSALLGDHSLWILDLDCCRDMTMDEAGVEQAWRAFYRNDPFYTRPGRDNEADQKLWVVLREIFLDASKVMLGPGSEIAHLPALLMSKIEGGGPVD